LALAFLLVFAPGCSEDDPVTPENNPPVLPALSDVDAVVGQELLLSFQATDRDGDAITYHLVVRAESIGAPLPIAGIDSETGAFHFTPLARDLPYRNFIVEVDDGHGGQDAEEFRVMITE